MGKTSFARVWGTGLLAVAAVVSLGSVAEADEYAITADPLVSRPATKPCVVPLFTDLRFHDYSPKTFDYAPPADCAGPWAKVVFEADYYVEPGRQFDRTANVWIGGVNIYFGTTPEPSATISPHWHVERDVTDYSPLFDAKQAGVTTLFNVVDTTYTSDFYGTADLQFYPMDPSEDPPVTADAVFALSDPERGAVPLDTFDNALERRFLLPTNVERAYLDVVAQSQATDEFWMLCVPDEVSGRLRSCPRTGFRETEVTIDGQPAGVAPVYPWIYTGGIDPYLWRPIPGVQTLNFVPYRVDLTPFAGLLSNGEEHSIAVRVYNANHRFDTTATLLVYLDAGASEVTGELTVNTLEPTPTPDIQVDVRTSEQGVTSGTVNVYSSRNFEIAGVVNTSHGTVSTTVEQRVDFSSEQQFDNVTPTSFAQDLSQSTRISTRTTVSDDTGDQVSLRRFQWPLALSFSITPQPDGTTARRTVVQQEYHLGEASGQFEPSRQTSSVLHTQDTLILRGSVIQRHEDQFSSHEYFTRDASGACYDRWVTSDSGVFTASFDGDRCGE